MKKEASDPNSVSQDQIHDLLFSREISWQEIIYDLINTEQLDPWNIDITVLTNKYLEKIQSLEEADFFVSSKVLLAAALLLRIKSDTLLNKYLKGIDDILFGKKQEKKYILERIELDEEIPLLVPRSPIPRHRKVTLKELMEALNKAITTENRRIKKEIIHKNALRETGLSLPKKRLRVKDRIRNIHLKLKNHFKKTEHKRISYTNFIGKEREDRITHFSPLLHLESSKKIWLEQETYFDEIHIWMKKTYLEHNGNPFSDLKEELSEKIQELDDGQKQRLKEVEKMGDLV